MNPTIDFAGPADDSPNVTVDHESIDVSQIKVRFRGDLRWTRSTGPNKSQPERYVVTDPVRGCSMAVGEVHRRLAVRLDGSRTIESAVCELAAEHPDLTMDVRTAATWVRFMVESGMAVGDACGTLCRQRDRIKTSQRASFRKWSNPLIQNFEFGLPKAVATVAGGTSGLFSPLAVGCWIVAMVAVSIAAVTNEQIFSGPVALWSSRTLALTAGVWLLLRVVHEWGHASAFARWGGRCRRGGVMLAMMVPLPFVDLSEMWTWPSRRRRIAVSLAGIYFESIIAMAAVVLMIGLDHPVVGELGRAVVLAVVFSSIIFNLNPLMKFDGYFVLIDLIGHPTLAEDSRSFSTATVARWFWGDATETLPMDRPHIVRVYAAASTLWRWTICVALMVAAESLFSGLGVVLSLAALVLMIPVPLVRAVVRRHQTDQLRLGSVAWRAAGMVGLVGSIAAAPIAPSIRAFGVMDYADVTKIRVDTDGELVAIDVSIGDLVKPGDVLGRVDNPNLKTRLGSLEARRRQNVLRWRQAIADGDPTMADIYAGRDAMFDEQIGTFLKRVEAQIIRSPIAGRITACDLVDASGVYLRRGDELMTIASGPIVVRGVIDEPLASVAVSRLTARLDSGETVALRRDTFRVRPKLSDRLPHQALGGHVGGPIAVVTLGRDHDLHRDETVNDGRESSDAAPMRMLRSRFVFQTEIDAPMRIDGGPIVAGRRVWLRLRGNDQTLGGWIIRHGRFWWDHRHDANERSMTVAGLLR